MSILLRLLLIEDSEDDARMLIDEIARGGFDVQWERVETPEAMASALDGVPWDLIISDNVLLHFEGLAVLELFQEKELDLPFIIVSGKSGEELAVRAMKAGAHDYILKNNLSRLVPAIGREMREAAGRREGRWAEKALRQSEERFHALFENAPVGIVIHRQGRIILANQAYLYMIGYENESEIYDRCVLEHIALECRLDAEERIRQRESGDVLPRMHEALGLKRDGTVFPVFVEIARFGLPDDLATVAFVSDITGVKRSEETLRESYRKLEDIFTQTVKALASITEMRDPYTAGHQVRVAQLACAIGVNMGLADEQIKTIKMAASIHDIGKTTIPAEILNKPGALNDVEMSLVQNHACSGYEILKNINFGEPVAEIVWQHHERLNGSGYPRGLDGDEIMIEARILAVADVVETMSSHRPYRPALMLEQALDEIRQQRGILYDVAVVDACLELFETRSFGFS
jgi:PAS domain S-box-containing protein